MVETTRSALAHLDGGARHEVDGIELVEHADLGMVVLRGDAEDRDFLAAVRNAASVDLPLAPNTSTETPPISVLWLGPDEWMLVCAGGSKADLVDSLNTALADQHAAVVDMSDARTALRLSGHRARTALTKGCALDLHPRAFAFGDVAQTMVAKAAVILHQTTDETDQPGPVFDIYVARSFADYLWRWLADTVSGDRRPSL